MTEGTILNSLPAGATVCTITHGGADVTVNCAGFRHRWPARTAAKMLNLEWEEFAQMLDESTDVLILLRTRGQKWRSSRLDIS